MPLDSRTTQPPFAGLTAAKVTGEDSAVPPGYSRILKKLFNFFAEHNYLCGIKKFKKSENV